MEPELYLYLLSHFVTYIFNKSHSTSLEFNCNVCKHRFNLQIYKKEISEKILIKDYFIYHADIIDRDMKLIENK